MDLAVSKGTSFNKKKSTLNKNKYNFRNKGIKAIIHTTDINKDNSKY